MNSSANPKTAIKMLIVEDDLDKFAIIASNFSKFNSESKLLSITIDHAKDILEATESFTKNYYDVVILDLKLPLSSGNGDDCNVDNSKGFYSHVLKSDKKPFLIVGLTSLKPEEYVNIFETHSTFNIETFSAGSDVWFKNIVSRIEFVAGARQALSTVMANNFNFDVIILVARENNEFDPIVDTVDWLGDFHTENPLVGHRKNAFGRVRIGSKILDIGIICLGEMGLSITSAITTQLVHIFRPRYFAMLGMCCGFKDEGYAKTKLGDVIIARQTANWDEGMYDGQYGTEVDEPFFVNRTKEKSPSSEFEADIDRVLESQWGDISENIKDYYLSPEARKFTDQVDGFDANPEIHFNLLLSGSSVINSVSKISEIRKRFSTSVGLEMESHSIYVATNALTGIRPKSVVIKGVADYGDGTKTKAVQKVASVASYKVLKAILDKVENNFN